MKSAISYTIKSLMFFALALLTMSAMVAITSFQASMEGTNIKIEWNITDETGVQVYELSRKRADDPSYTKIHSVPPSGKSTYEYIDTELFKIQNGTVTQGTLQSGTISYRLIVKTTNGNAIYYTATNGSPTAVQRSWGSIKAMFR